MKDELQKQEYDTAQKKLDDDKKHSYYTVSNDQRFQCGSVKFVFSSVGVFALEYKSDGSRVYPMKEGKSFVQAGFLFFGPTSQREIINRKGNRLKEDPTIVDLYKLLKKYYVHK